MDQFSSRTSVHTSPRRIKFECISCSLNCLINISLWWLLDISNDFFCCWINCLKCLARFRFVPFVVYEKLKRMLKIHCGVCVSKKIRFLIFDADINLFQTTFSFVKWECQHYVQNSSILSSTQAAVFTHDTAADILEINSIDKKDSVIDLSIHKKRKEMHIKEMRFHIQHRCIV